MKRPDYAKAWKQAMEEAEDMMPQDKEEDRRQETPADEEEE